MKIHLKYLTDDPQKQKACQDYWLQEADGFVLTVREVAQKHELQYRGISNLVAQWSQAYSLEDACSQCGSRYWVFKSRTEYAQRASSHGDWICGVCEQHNQEVIQQQRAAQREEVRNYFRTYTKGKVCFQENGPSAPNALEQVTALLSMIRLGASEDLTYIRSLAEIGEQRLSPTTEYDSELIRSLIRTDVLSPKVDESPLSAFLLDEEGFTGQFYIFSVAWDFPLTYSYGTDEPIDDPAHLIHRLDQTFLNMDWPESWYDQWLPLWQKISLNECLQYLDLCMTEHGFQFKAGEKTRQILINALTTFSVAQTFNFIWGSARNAAAYYMRENVSRRQAANSVVGAIQRRADQARAEGWDVKAFHRDRRCPQTMISQVLFDTVLQIGEDGFFKPPSEN